MTPCFKKRAFCEKACQKAPTLFAKKRAKKPQTITRLCITISNNILKLTDYIA
jgi:hypothetical protein